MDEFGQLALIALGSNRISKWGDAAETVQMAMHSLQSLALSPIQPSRLYSTPAFPAGSGPDFVNMACAFFTKLSAPDLLQALHAIEADAGRTRDQRWAPRTLDLDLIALGQQVCPDAVYQAHWMGLPIAEQSKTAPDTLILPHPRVQDRSFVLVPLADVAPHWCHPVLDLTVTQMLDALSDADRASVVPLP